MALVSTARRPGDGEDFVGHGTWILMANGQRINNRTERGGRGEVDASRSGWCAREEGGCTGAGRREQVGSRMQVRRGGSAGREGGESSEGQQGSSGDQGQERKREKLGLGAGEGQ
jgi:hypothetical protein